MENNNKSIELLVICNEEKYLKETIEWYNSIYKTDFTIVKMLYDEVNFAMLRVSKYKYEDLFSLGYQFGVKEQTLRQKRGNRLVIKITLGLL